ncbi:MAG: hypothetical protein K0S44_773 [Bacteroidetes bacterium]|jgi:hypothetical protein|nr:hypothetical protein [Bacteroidota bacterium]
MIIKAKKYSITENFFLKKHVPKPSTIALLQNIYPTVNWQRVDFYEGLPWYTPIIAPYVTAQALPQFYSFSRFRIYLKKFDESRAQCLADIVHEGMHVLQGMSYMKGYGLGMFRGFIVRYGAFFMKYGYRNNPFEIPAYDQEYRFLDFCEKYHQHGIVPPINIDALKNISTEKELVFKNAKVSYNENIFLFILSFISVFFIAIIKPIADLIVFLLKSFQKK